MVTSAKICWYSFVAIVGFSALSTISFAQLNQASSTLEAGATTPSQSEIISEPAPSSVPVWYGVEMIAGNEIAVGDFVVGPGRTEVTVKPGESVTRMMTLTNRVADGKTFYVEVEDMSGSADGSEAVVLLGDVVGPYTLKDYITFNGKNIYLDLGERAQIPVTITMPVNAEPGGYYGAVLVSTVQDVAEKDENSVAQSPIIARIGTLFFITVPGEAEVSGSVTDVSTTNDRWWYQKGPINLNILFENTGSVHLNPYGAVSIYNMFGEEVGNIELEPWFVLPKSLRLREISWDRELLFGRYAFEVTVERGYGNLIDTNTVYVWVMPWKIIGGIFGGIFVLILTLRFFARTFEFKRRGK